MEGRGGSLSSRSSVEDMVPLDESSKLMKVSKRKFIRVLRKWGNIAFLNNVGHAVYDNVSKTFASIQTVIGTGPEYLLFIENKENEPNLTFSK